MKKPKDGNVDKLIDKVLVGEDPKSVIENAVNATVPYNNLPPLLPETEIETIQVLKKVAKARGPK